MSNRNLDQEIYTIILSWINNCDSKSATVLSCIGVVAGIICTSDYSEKIMCIYDSISHMNKLWSVIYLGVWWASVMLIMAGCLFLVFVLVSHTNIKGFQSRKIRRDSVIFFSTIAENKTLLEYRKKLAKYDSGRLNNDYISQIYVCSIICDRKFKNYKAGLILSIIGFSIFFILLSIGSIYIY